MSTTKYASGTVITSASLNDIDTKTYEFLTAVSGTNTIVATGPASMTAYATGQTFYFIAQASNTGAATINITPQGGTALGAKAIVTPDGVALAANQLVANRPAEVIYNGTSFILLTPGVLPFSMGGTGAQTPANALNNLGVGISNLASEGYTRLPGGVYMQWGSSVGTTNSGSVIIVTFPIAFPNNCFTVVASNGDPNTSLPRANVTTAPASQTSFPTVWSSAVGVPAGAGQAARVNWVAFGN